MAQDDVSASGEQPEKKPVCCLAWGSCDTAVGPALHMYAHVQQHALLLYLLRPFRHPPAFALLPLFCRRDRAGPRPGGGRDPAHGAAGGRGAAASASSQRGGRGCGASRGGRRRSGYRGRRRERQRGGRRRRGHYAAAIGGGSGELGWL